MPQILTGCIKQSLQVIVIACLCSAISLAVRNRDAGKFMSDFEAYLENWSEDIG